MTTHWTVDDKNACEAEGYGEQNIGMVTCRKCERLIAKTFRLALRGWAAEARA